MLKSMKKLGDGGKRKPAEIITREKKTISAAPTSISKSEAEDKVAGIKRMQEEQADITQGEKDFGSAYKSLGLKGTRKVSVDKEGNASLSADYKSAAGDESVKRIPNSEVLEVTKLGEAGKTDNPVFKETFKERIERIATEKKAAGRAKAMAILDAEKRKAQAKAGMK